MFCNVLTFFENTKLKFDIARYLIVRSFLNIVDELIQRFDKCEDVLAYAIWSIMLYMSSIERKLFPISSMRNFVAFLFSKQTCFSLLLKTAIFDYF